MSADALTNLIIVTFVVGTAAFLAVGYALDQNRTQAERASGPEIIGQFTQGPRPPRPGPRPEFVYPPLPTHPPVRRETGRP
ncbi:hypothetical protein ACFXKG_18285 [Streptomyces sp. NPDC059255]|uniref:hypothetical protein n=1 Tax=Streptomyces sp. NPDC059255 TaxID=3346793 RepID=UPI0036CD0A6C